MKWRLTTLGVGMVWAGLLFGAGSARPLTGPAIIDITQVQVRHHGSQRQTDDDEFWGYYLHNERITRAVIGNSTLRCEFYFRGGAFGSGTSECLAIYTLRKGTIIARGKMRSRRYYRLAILGGTGIYSNVRGQVLATTIESRPHQERLLFGLEV